jgi:hypothetical protein
MFAADMKNHRSENHHDDFYFSLDQAGIAAHPKRRDILGGEGSIAVQDTHSVMVEVD